MIAIRPCIVALAPFVALSAARADSGSFSAQNDVIPAVLNASDRFGSSVAIEGDRLAVGAPATFGMGAGRVIVFERQAGVWVETATIVGGGLPDGSRFGARVELSGDTLFATAATGTTEAFVFEFDGVNWIQVTAVAAAPPNDSTASDVAISGTTLVLGTGNSAPRVHVFERTGTDWSQTQETVLVASDGQNLGSAVAIDGDVLVAGAPSANAGGFIQAGRVYVFERTAGVWGEVANFASMNTETQGFFGLSVAVCGDWIAAGSPTSELPVQLPSSGLLEVFQRANGGWSHHQLITNPTELGFELFGQRVAMSADRLAVGATGPGLVWVYTREDDLWIEQASIGPPPNLLGGAFGDALDIEFDRIAVGEPAEALQGFQSGSAHVYERMPMTPVAYCTAKTTTEGCVPAVGWNGGASLTGSDDFAVLARDVPPGRTGLFFWGTSGRVAVPFLGGTLCVAPSLTRGPVLLSTGVAPCDGGFVLPFTQALMQQEGLDVCQTVNGQWWMRDPQNPDGTGVALTDGVEFTVDF